MMTMVGQVWYDGELISSALHLLSFDVMCILTILSIVSDTLMVVYTILINRVVGTVAHNQD